MRVEVFTSVEGGAFFIKLLEEWCCAGAEVRHRYAVSSEEYRTARGRLSRLRLRWRMYAGFFWACWRRARSCGASLRVVTTNPFFAPAVVARGARGRGATIHLLYDLFPDALIHAGAVRADSWLAGICARSTRYALRECEATVFLGWRLQAHTEATYGPARRAEIIPVGADGAPFRDHPPRAPAAAQPPRILYCGQMGRMHEVDTVLGALCEAEAAAFDWRFHANGASYARLRATLADGKGPIAARITLADPLPDAEWVEAMQSAHIALVTMAPGAEKVVMPSKTYSALVAGQAVLAVCPRESDLADLVLEHDCGWVVAPGDVAGLRAVLREIAARPELLQAKRERAFEAGHAHYDCSVVAKQWIELFRGLEAATPQPPALV